MNSNNTNISIGNSNPNPNTTQTMPMGIQQPSPVGYNNPNTMQKTSMEIKPSKNEEQRRKEILKLLESGVKDKKDIPNSKDYSNTFLAKILKKISILDREKKMIIIDTILLLASVGINIWMWSRINQLRIKNLEKTKTTPTPVDNTKIDDTTTAMWLLLICIAINILTIIMRLFIFRFNWFSIPQSLTGIKPWVKSSIILGFNLLFNLVTAIIFSLFLKSGDQDSENIKRDFWWFFGGFSLIIVIVTGLRVAWTANDKFEKDREQIRKIDEDIAGEVISFLNDKDGKASTIENLNSQLNYYKNSFEKSQEEIIKKDATINKLKSLV